MNYTEIFVNCVFIKWSQRWLVPYLEHYFYFLLVDITEYFGIADFDELDLFQVFVSAIICGHTFI